MKVAIYVRVSTDEQAREGYSIESQKDSVINFVKSQRWEIYDFYIDDGYSAKDLKRPAMQRLIEDTKERKFDVVVFYKLDRLVRSVGDLDKLLKLFDKHNIGIRSVTEPFDTTTAMGRFLITLVAAIAQWERETISERVIINMAKKATLGERNGGKAPFGYNIEDGKLVINEEEAHLVREMFRMYIAGKGIRQIVLYLQQFGVDKDIRTVSRMLENPVYCGKLRWGKNSKMTEIISDDITHPPIVDIETFDKAQKLRKQRSQEGKKATSPYPFSGVLRCARCGSALSGYYKKARGSKHYICIAKKNKGTCDLPIFTERALTQVFLENLSPNDPNKFLNLIRNVEIKTENEDHTVLIAELEKELAAIKTRKRNWLLALGNGTITQEEYKEMTVEDSKKETLIKEQLEQLSKKAVTLDLKSVLSIVKNISTLWETANDYEKKSFINELFEAIVVDVPSDYFRGRGKTPSVIIKEVHLR
ncbi:recombinase family protein [Anoxybacillus gonensis]|uniref:recombinase family protein n=1 Tax=Anoxybacillus gonensis TaxID=198467 RepID=UPI003D769DF7